MSRTHEVGCQFRPMRQATVQARSDHGPPLRSMGTSHFDGPLEPGSASPTCGLLQPRQRGLGVVDGPPSPAARRLQCLLPKARADGGCQGRCYGHGAPLPGGPGGPRRGQHALGVGHPPGGVETAPGDRCPLAGDGNLSQPAGTEELPCPLQLMPTDQQPTPKPCSARAWPVAVPPHGPHLKLDTA